jgi:hypothetical protein
MHLPMTVPAFTSSAAGQLVRSRHCLDGLNPTEVGAELEAPPAHALVAGRDAPLGQDELHLAQAQAEDVIEPHGVADDLGREAVFGVVAGPDVIPRSWPVHFVPASSNQLGDAGSTNLVNMIRHGSSTSYHASKSYKGVPK